MKKNIFFILFLCINVCVFGINSVFASNGSCGTNLTWTWNSPSLNINGTGAMKNYVPYATPWYGIRNAIKKVNIENNVTSIGNYAFYECIALTNVSMPDSITHIGDYAFFHCYSLTNVILSNNTTEIGNSAFYLCSKLKSITIPKSVTVIGSNAFRSCSSLEEVYYQGTEEDWLKISVGSNNNCLTNAKINYENSTPQLLLDTYKISVIGVEENCVLVVASYEDLKLVDAKFIPISKDTTVTVLETELDTTNSDTIKSFLWQSAQNLKSLCNMQCITIE